MQLVNDVLTRDRMLVMVASRDPENEQPGPDDLYRVGVAGIVARMLKMPDGTLRILVQGGQRVRIDEFVSDGALPRRAHPRGARRPRAIERAGGAQAAHPADLLGHHRGPSLPAGGAAGRGRERRRPRGARPHDRGVAADQDRGQAGAARGTRRHQAAAAAVGDPRPRARGDGARLQDPVAGPVRDGQDPARVPAARAAEGDPAGARRGGRDAGRDRGAAPADRGGRPAGGRAHRSRARARPARAAATGGGRVRRDPHLPRVDRHPAVVQVDRGQPRPRARAQDPEPRPLRHRQGQGADHRVPRGAQAEAGQRRARSSASSARRASARPRSASRSPRRSGASSSASRSAACATRPRSAGIAAPTSARCRARSSARCATPAATTPCS